MEGAGGEGGEGNGLGGRTGVRGDSEDQGRHSKGIKGKGDGWVETAGVVSAEELGTTRDSGTEPSPVLGGREATECSWLYDVCSRCYAGDQGLDGGDLDFLL